MMKMRQMIPLMAVVGVLISGCGTIQEVFLGALRDAAVEAVQTATSQIAEEVVGEIGSELLEGVNRDEADGETP